MTGRIFQTRRIWTIQPEAFRRAVELIAESERDHRPELVVGIERGGRPLAEALAARLGLPVTTVRARHNPNDQIRVPDSGSVTVDPGLLLDAPPGRRVLLADDICGSGATLHTVNLVLTALIQPAAVRTVTLCRNTGTAQSPHTWVWDVSDWVAFPWETAPAPDEPTEPLPLPESARHP